MFAATREVKLYVVARQGTVDIALKSIAKSVINKPINICPNSLTTNL